MGWLRGWTDNSKRVSCATTTHNGQEVLPIVLLGIRSSWKDDVQASSAELVYGEPLRLPGQFLSPSDNHTVEDITIWQNTWLACLRGQLSGTEAILFIYPQGYAALYPCLCETRLRAKVIGTTVCRSVQGTEEEGKVL